MTSSGSCAALGRATLSYLNVATAQEVRVEHGFIESLINGNLVDLNSTKGVSLELCLATEQDADFGVDRQFVEVSAGPKHVERGNKSVGFDGARHGCHEERWPRQESAPVVEAYLQEAEMSCWLDKTLGGSEAMVVVQRAFICREAPGRPAPPALSDEHRCDHLIADLKVGPSLFRLLEPDSPRLATLLGWLATISLLKGN
jgi:hypothetical protein